MTADHFGPYRLIYTVGAGGMGQVYLARHAGEHGIDRLVALKRILKHLSRHERLVTLFLDEVRVAAQLNHGNIVQVIDHGCIDGQYFMAMEYVHGENLDEVLQRLADRGQQLPLDLLLHVASSICEGLDYAHGKESLDGRPLRLVHRDISPHNVLLSFSGQVKIADFGVARAAEQTHQTMGGELRGKLAYMSPEQAYGEALDHRSDLFALGAVLYEALAGTKPFARDNPMATLEAVRAAEPVRLSMVRRDLPEDVVALVHRALSRDREQRPDSARSMHDELQRLIRVHNLAVSTFDLGDYLGDLFPESLDRGAPGSEDAKGEGTGGEGTAVGRRADELPPVEALERRTLFYLRQRHPGGETTTETPGGQLGDDRPTRVERPVPGSSTTGAVRALHGGRRRSLRVVGILGVLAAVGLAGWGGFHLLGRPADHSVGAAADAVVVDAAVVDAGVVDAGQPEAAVAAADAGPGARGTGQLALSTAPPGAEVSAGGRKLGRTPLSRALPAGRHRITAVLPGYKHRGERVRISSGQRLALRWALEALPARLEVRSTDRCTVHVGGKPLGPTPLARAVPPGRLVVRCADRAAGIDVTRTVRSRSGQTARLALRFGHLAVNLQPWAAVTVDRKRRGTTPLRLLLPVGEHRVVLDNRAQGRQRTVTVDVRQGQTTRISHW